jgi:hypothetical protein
MHPPGASQRRCEEQPFLAPAVTWTTIMPGVGNNKSQRFQVADPRLKRHSGRSVLRRTTVVRPNLPH